MSVCSRSNWNLDLLVFEERGKLEHAQRKTSWSKINSHGVDVRIRTLVTLVGGKCSHHGATLVLRVNSTTEGVLSSFHLIGPSLEYT